MKSGHLSARHSPLSRRPRRALNFDTLKTTKARPALTFEQAEKQLNRVCDQLQLLDNKIADMEIRKQRAERDQQEAQLQQIEMQLGVLQHTYSMFHEFANRKIQQLALLEMSALMEPAKSLQS